MSKEEMIISALVDLVNAKNENIKTLEAKIKESEAEIADLDNILDGYNEPKPKTKKPNYLLDKL